MPLTFQPEADAEKAQLVTSLAALILADCKAEITAESLEAVISSSGNKANSTFTTLYASFIAKAGDVDKFMAGPSAGGGGGGAAPAAAAGGAPKAAAAPEKPKEEEVDALDGGMDMFGGGGAKGGGGDY